MTAPDAIAGSDLVGVTPAVYAWVQHDGSCGRQNFSPRELNLLRRIFVAAATCLVGEMR
jgi:hypothetical protein